MIKKIILISLMLITFSLVCFLVYTVNLNNRSFNTYVKEKRELQTKYNQIIKHISEARASIQTVQTEKDTINIEIAKVNQSLTTVNNAIAAKERIIAEANAKYKISNNIGTKTAYFTFDDGPSGYTNKILDILKEYGIKATFFVKGKTDTYSRGLYQRIVNESHTIGNHTFTHSYPVVYSSVETFNNDFNNLQTYILGLTGVTMSVMRFPGGSNNPQAEKTSPGILDTLTTNYKALGYQYFDWNVTSGDAASSGVTNASVINSILNGCRSRNFAIILMHDTAPTTINTLETLIISLANTGYRFSPLTTSSYAIHFK